MSKAGKRITGVIIIIVIAAALFYLTCSHFFISGVICINTKNYADPVEAFCEGENSDVTYDESSDYSGLKEITTVRVDEHNAFFIAEAENGNVIVSHMKTARGGYFYLGSMFEYDMEEECETPYEYTMTVSRLKNSTFFSGHIEIGMCMEASAPNADEGYTSVPLPSPLEDCFFVYRIID